MTTSVPPYFPFPNFYEEIHREALTCLKLELFEGMRMDLTKFFSEKFCISHSMMAGPTAIPSQSSKIIKTPTSNYDFGANYTDSRLMLLGKMTMDGRLNAKFKYDFTHNLALKANVQLTDEPHKSHGLINFDYKGSDYRVQFHMGSGGLLGATCMQNVTPRLSLGWEVFRAGQHSKFDGAYVARYNDGKTIATGQFRKWSGVIALSYVHKVTEKVCLASDFMYNYMFQDIRASFGYYLNIPNSRGYIGRDHNIVMTQIRGKIDSNGVVAVLVEHAGGVVYSFEFDHSKLDYKIGFGFKISDYSPVFSQDE